MSDDRPNEDGVSSEDLLMRSIPDSSGYTHAVRVSSHPAFESLASTECRSSGRSSSWCPVIEMPLPGGLRTTCMVYGSPGHSWQNVAAIGSSIGEKGIIYAAKVLAVSALELIEQPQGIAAARADLLQNEARWEAFALIEGDFAEGQNPATLQGKMIRIDVEGVPDPGLNYAIPSDNPFVLTGGVPGEIWAFGLRNPWRWSFDRKTGDMYIADVGQGSREEVNFAPASNTGGKNYQWRREEGFTTFSASTPLSTHQAWPG